MTGFSGATGPSAEFVNTLACWAWLERTGMGPAAFILLAHPDASSVQQELYDLALALRLAAPARRIPEVGPRVAIVGGDRAAVRMDGCAHMVQVEVGAAWADFVASGGSVALVVGLTSLERRAPRDVVQRYLARNAMSGGLRLGLAESVGSFTVDEADRRAARGSWAASAAGYGGGVGAAGGAGCGLGGFGDDGGTGGGLRRYGDEAARGFAFGGHGDEAARGIRPGGHGGAAGPSQGVGRHAGRDVHDL
jgi:hypothetical protein